MMPLLVAAVILVGTLCLLDLTLTFGVVRRLREHTQLLDDLLAGTGARAGAAAAAILPSEGHMVGEFMAETADGVPVSRDLLPAHAVVIFMAADCPACRTKLPGLVEWASSQDRQRVLVVIDGQVTDPSDLVEKLSPVAHVVVETSGTPVMDAFGVSGFHAFCVVAEGKIVSAGVDVSRPPAVARA